MPDLMLLLAGIWIWSLYGRLEGKVVHKRISKIFEWGMPAYLLLILSHVAVGYVRGWRIHDDAPPPIELGLPFSEGAYVVAAGGDSETINHHVSSERQRYALDIARNDLLKNSLVPAFIPLGDLVPGRADLGLRQNSSFRIWDTSVVSPCVGKVIETDTRWADRDAASAPGQDNLDYPGGNFVDINCDAYPDITVHLSHLQQDSISVTAGDRVSPSTVIGRVGNSGNTTEPHLHLEAYNSERKGVPILVSGRFLVRGSVVQ